MAMSISWVYLIIAGCLECDWAIGIKYIEGFILFLKQKFYNIS